jgi:hypothetical protein
MEPSSDMHAAADRYVYGRMSAEESEQFEVEMLRNPALAAEVNLTQQMRGGLRRLEEQRRLDTVLARGLSRPGPVAWAAAAAIAVIAVAVALMLFATRQSPQTRLLATALSVHVESRPVARTLVLASRRDESVPGLTLEKAAGPVGLRVLPTDAASGTYAVELRLATDTAGEPLGKVDASPDANGFLAVDLNTQRLSAGRYVVQISRGGEVVESFPFEIAFAP